MARPKMDVTPATDEDRAAMTFLTNEEVKEKNIGGKLRVYYAKMNALNASIDARAIQREETGGTLEDRFKKLEKDERALADRREKLEAEKAGGLPAMDATEIQLRTQLARVNKMAVAERTRQDESDAESADFSVDDPFN